MADLKIIIIYLFVIKTLAVLHINDVKERKKQENTRNHPCLRQDEKKRKDKNYDRNILLV